MHKFKITNAEGGTAFLVQVAPEAAGNRITGKDSDVVYVDLTSPPRQEAVNHDLTAFLSERLNVDLEQIAITSGSSIEKKLVIIMGLAPEEIDRRLAP
ncbi:MAG: DUF167 family protein [Anaerolineae bacterium]